MASNKKKLLVLFVGATLLTILIGCATPTKPTFKRTIDDPVMTPVEIEAEFEQLRQLNLTVGSEGFDPGVYPLFAGVDVRNGKTLIKKFICWDGCPELGKVYLVYQGVDTEEACFSATGSPLISPVPISGRYWGCEPILDWLRVPSRRPS